MGLSPTTANLYSYLRSIGGGFVDGTFGTGGVKPTIQFKILLVKKAVRLCATSQLKAE